ncbi:MAG: ETC complex I subunit [Rubrimonas sp.]
MLARIFQPARSAMTSGQAKTRAWVLEYTPEVPKKLDPLMGWTGSRDMLTQVRLSFDTREEAVDYAQRNGIPYVLTEPRKRAPVVRPKGYGANFATERKQAWTH